MSAVEQPLINRVIGTRSEMFLVAVMVGILLVLFTPIPSFLLDFLLLINVSFGLMILLLTLYTDKPLAFSTFPSLILIATLFRLSLNIAATRLILSDANAGEVIRAVGVYVVGGNYVIGLVVFLILIVVQYVVVTNGSQRVAEVAARFTLDSMPGKQMSIDADLNMGLITEKDARERRDNIEKEANFYGAMDGASKFVKGDAIAGIIIILIDIIGGLAVGIAQKGMSWSQALHTYTLLTVGDGIVTQIPALVISVATGIIVTRAATDSVLGEAIAGQITRYPKSLVIIGFGLLALLVLPGIPFFPVFTLMLVVLGAAGWMLFGKKEKEPIKEAESSIESEPEDAIYNSLQVDFLGISVGDGLAPFVEKESAKFLENIANYRKQFALEMGFVLPALKVVRDRNIAENAYQIKIRGNTIATGELFWNKLLAISANDELFPIEGGIQTKDPTYGLPALWIDPMQRELSRSKGYTVVDPDTVLITHVTETLKNYAHELFSRSECEQLLNKIKATQNALVEEVVPGQLTLGELQKVMQVLLKEKVSIRPFEFILENLTDFAKQTKEPEELAEKLRVPLGRTICEALASKSGELKVLSLDPAVEQAFQNGLRKTEDRVVLSLDPNVTEMVFKKLGYWADQMLNEQLRPTLICSPSIRRHLRKLTERVIPHLVVLSLHEIPTNIPVRSFGIVQIDRDARS